MCKSSVLDVVAARRKVVERLSMYVWETESPSCNDHHLTVQPSCNDHHSTVQPFSQPSKWFDQQSIQLWHSASCTDELFREWPWEELNSVHFHESWLNYSEPQWFQINSSGERQEDFISSTATVRDLLDLQFDF
jgi:hypothetical protein